MKKARILDYETSGMPDDDGAEIIEFGRYDLNLETLAIENPWQSLACPRRQKIEPGAQAAHHIHLADLQDAPQARELWSEFFDGMEEGEPLVAHNTKFEQHFTPDDGRPWICTMKVARIVYPGAPTHSNQGLRYWLELDVDRTLAEPAHRALPDAYITAHLLKRMLEFKTIEQMINISKYPSLLYRITFGKKAKGQLYSEAPLDYLTWIRDQSDMDEDTKFTCNYWIRKRA